MSSFTWLAHSEAERRRTLDVIRLLDEPGTLDEIGIGGIRDAFAELLFPGTSTIQTRARYFLFVPWIYRDLERRAPVAKSQERARRAEVRLIEALLAAGETNGLIGRVARAGLKRLPSEIYWQGLETWGIRSAPISLRAYHRRLERLRFGAASEEDDGGSMSLWHGDLPDPPADFPRAASLSLSPAEVDYLRDRILTRCPGTLLASILLSSAEAPDASYPWELDHAVLDAAPPEVREQLRHARAFSDLIYGAQLLYNLMLAEAAERPEETERYSTDLHTWADELLAHRVRL